MGFVSGGEEFRLQSWELFANGIMRLPDKMEKEAPGMNFTHLKDVSSSQWRTQFRKNFRLARIEPALHVSIEINP